MPINEDVEVRVRMCRRSFLLESWKSCSIDSLAAEIRKWPRCQPDIGHRHRALVSDAAEDTHAEEGDDETGT